MRLTMHEIADVMQIAGNARQLQDVYKRQVLTFTFSFRTQS